MANIPRLRSPGLWVLGSVVLAEEFESFDEVRPWLINAASGSTHAPSAQIVLGGAGLRVSGPSRLDSITIAVLAATGTLTVADNSTLIVSGGTTGGRIQVDGSGAVPGRIDVESSAEIRVKSGGFINVQSGGSLDVRGGFTLYTGAAAVVQTGVNINLNAGSTLLSNGAFYFASSTWPLLAPTRTWTRRSLLIATTTHNATSSDMPVDPNAVKTTISGGGDRIITRSTQRSSDYTLIEFPDVPEGQTITQIEISCIGFNAGTVGMTFPSFEAVRWRGTSRDSMSSITADTHILANWNITTVSTTITITSNAVINRDYQYGLMIYHGYYSGSPAGAAYFWNAVMTGTATDLRV